MKSKMEKQAKLRALKGIIDFTRGKMLSKPDPMMPEEKLDKPAKPMADPSPASVTIMIASGKKRDEDEDEDI